MRSDRPGASFQTYIHEIGHALGLGHSGDYNGEGQYPYDATFQIDGWPASIMSYFAQNESSYWADQGFTFRWRRCDDWAGLATTASCSTRP